MGLIFKEDFETGTTAMESIVTDGCSIEISNELPLSGVYSAKCYIFSQPAFSNAFLRKTILQTLKVYTELLIRIDSFTPSGGSYLYGFESIVGRVVFCHVGLDRDRHLRLIYRDAGAYKTVISTTILDVGVSYKINLEISVGTDATIRILVNDMEITDLTITGIDNADVGGIDKVEAGARSGYNLEAVISVDDLLIADTPLPIVYHYLSVDSTPLTAVPFILDGVEQATPYSVELEEGSHTIAMPASVAVEGRTYLFKEWEDTSTNPQRTINLTFDMALTAIYELVPTHTLTIDSTPIRGIPVTIEKVS